MVASLPTDGRRIAQRKPVVTKSGMGHHERQLLLRRGGNDAGRADGGAYAVVPALLRINGQKAHVRLLEGSGVGTPL